MLIYMVRISARTYDDLPSDLREKARYRMEKYATRNELATKKFQNDRHLLGHVYPKMSRDDKAIIKEIYRSGGIDLHENPAGITLDQVQEVETHYLANAKRAYEVADDALATGFNAVGHVGKVTGKVALAGGKAGVAVGKGVVNSVSWTRKRSIGTQVMIASLGGFIFSKFIELYTGTDITGTVKSILVNTTVWSGFALTSTLTLLALGSCVAKIYEYAQLYKNRERDMALVDRAENALPETVATEEDRTRDNDLRGIIRDLNDSNNRTQKEMFKMQLDAQKEARQETNARLDKIIMQNDRQIKIAEENQKLSRTTPKRVSPARAVSPRPAVAPCIASRRLFSLDDLSHIAVRSCLVAESASFRTTGCAGVRRL